METWKEKCKIPYEICILRTCHTVNHSKLLTCVDALFVGVILCFVRVVE